MLSIRRSKLQYTASGIITLKQVSDLKLLKYNSINMSNIYVCLVYLVIKSYKLLISCCIYKVVFVRLLELLKIQCVFTLLTYKKVVFI